MKELKFTLTTSSGAVVLESSPDGWSESLIQWARSDKYWGVFRSFTVALKFVKTGATQLRTEFYQYGTAGTASIVIERLNKITLQYSVAYSGICDFGTYKDTDNYVEVNLVDSGIAKDIKDNGGVEYSIGGSDIWLSGFKIIDTGNTAFCAELKTVAYVLIDLMTGGKLTSGEYIFKSTLLDAFNLETSYYNIVLTTGLNIRIPDVIANKSLIKTTFEDFFKSINLFTSCGIGTGTDPDTGKPMIEIESKDYFFDFSSTDINLGASKNIISSIDTKLSPCKIKSGWEARDYDDVLQKEREPNATSLWVTNNDTSTVEYDLTGKYRADSTGIQNCITEGAFGSDSADDDIFLVECIRDVITPSILIYYPLTKTKQTGLPTEWFIGNGTLTPRRCIEKNKLFIQSLLFNYVGKTIDFTSGGNDLYNIESSLWNSYTYVAERTSVILGLPTYFIPIIFEVECALPSDLIDQLNSNSTRRASFKFEGNTFYGWIMDVKAQLSGRGSGKIKLLSLPNNDLTKLIR